MASTRSKAATRRAATPVRKQAPFALVRRCAHIQIAAGTAATRTLTERTQAADRLAQTVGDEMLRRVNGETDSAELLAGMAAAGSTHLRELTALPRAAADHFDTRLARVSTND